MIWARSRNWRSQSHQNPQAIPNNQVERRMFPSHYQFYPSLLIFHRNRVDLEDQLFQASAIRYPRKAREMYHRLVESLVRFSESLPLVET